MKVSTAEPYQIVYSLFQHEYLGCLFESFVVQKDDKDRLTLRHQNISHKNMMEFDQGLDDNDYRLIELIDEIQQDIVIKKFFNKKIAPADFFLKIYDKEKGDKAVQVAIENYIDSRKAEILDLLQNKMVFEMGSDGEPTWKHLEIVNEKASVLFHFRRNEDNTHYFPTIKCKGEKVEFQYKNAIVLCNEPAWLLVEDKVYHFEKSVDGKKLKPFLNKKFILIPRKVEETYYKKFVAPLIESFDVYAKGFEIKSERYEATPVLTLTDLGGDTAPSLFGDENTNGNNTKEQENPKIVMDLSFEYGDYLFSSQNHTKASVKMEKQGDDYIFHRVARSMKWEQERLNTINELGMPIKHGRAAIDKYKVFSWLENNSPTLESLGFKIRQKNNSDKKYFLGKTALDIEIKENNDWFDIHAKVRFGEYEIPFLQLRKYILKKQREFTLPNGEIAVIPDEWFVQYSEFFAFSQEKESGENLQLKKHHLALVNDMKEGNLAKVTLEGKLSKLKDFESIEDFALPKSFKGDLRAYQKAGFNWLNFLKEYNFGGCLADDMGLGKTVQTLAMLQAQKEAGVTNATLLVLPTSLLYNWMMEAEKFTPDLKIYNYTGTNREKDVANFEGYDLVITSYGIVRLDVDILSEYYFNYIILDESQAIKNPSSNIAQSVKKLKSKYRLVLTGTPIENSTMDLWSQMSFVNPGLLGSERFFKNEFMIPIEKKKDEEKTRKLNSIIKPFILRRNKSQVVKDLPPKMENIRYVQMTDEQKEKYEETKSYYRNKILKEIDEKGVASSQILLLQGLMKLRQMANHPKLVEEDFEGESGKMEDVSHMLVNAITNDHKILVFSQFVKHLAIVKDFLDKEKIPYTYLDGSTRNRQEEVNKFQEQDEIKVFLISLKAGGLGLNLTAADYVFLLDPWWNPAVEAQAVDRAHRIGQKNTVFTYKYISKDTVEEKILALQQKKLKLVKELISTEESFMKSLSRDDIASLFD